MPPFMLRSMAPSFLPVHEMAYRLCNGTLLDKDSTSGWVMILLKGRMQPRVSVTVTE